MTTPQWHFTHICTWPPSGDLVKFLHFPKYNNSSSIFFEIFSLLSHTYIYINVYLTLTLNIILYSNDQTSIKLKLINTWNVIGMRRFFLNNWDIWYYWECVLSIYCYSRKYAIILVSNFTNWISKHPIKNKPTENLHWLEEKCRLRALNL